MGLKMTHHLRFLHHQKIRPIDPYSFKLTAMCYATRWDFDGERAYIPYFMGEKAFCLVVYEEEGIVTMEIHGEKMDDEAIEQGIDIAERVMGLHENIEPYYQIIEDDPLLGIIPRKYRGLHMRAVPTLWEGVIIGICQQNASFNQGWRMVVNLRKILGEEIVLQGPKMVLKAMPKPDRIIRSPDKLIEARVGYRKETMIRIANAAIRNEMEPLEQIRGIGQYTARLARIIAERKYDEFPIDRWFMRLIPYAYEGRDEAWPKKDIDNFSAKLWGRWRGLSAIMITIVTAARPIRMAIESISRGDLDIMSLTPSPMTLWRVEL